MFHVKHGYINISMHVCESKVCRYILVENTIDLISFTDNERLHKSQQRILKFLLFAVGGNELCFETLVPRLIFRKFNHFPSLRPNNLFVTLIEHVREFILIVLAARSLKAFRENKAKYLGLEQNKYNT